MSSTEPLVGAAWEPHSGGYGPRIGCGFCFDTLDPEDRASSDRRVFVRCNQCRRVFHRGCWRGRCTRPGCSSESCSSAQVSPPHPLRINAGELTPTVIGPVNSIDDVPLGISRGTMLFLDDRPQQIELRNNSDEVVLLAGPLGPPWVTTSFCIADRWDEDGPQAGAISERVELAPGERVEVVVRPQRFRPTWMRYYTELNDEQGFEVVSDLRSVWFPLGLTATFLLVVHHWYRFVSASAPGQGRPIIWLAASLGMIVGWLTLLSPSRAQKALLWTLHRLAGRDRPFQGGRAVRGWKVAFGRDDSGPTPGQLALRSTRAALAGLLAALVAWPIGWALVGLLGQHTAFTEPKGLFLLGLGYALVLACGWHLWFRAYNLDLIRPAGGLGRWMWDHLTPAGWGKASGADRLLAVATAILALVLLVVLYGIVGTMAPATR